MLKEFKEFISRGNVLDLAVGVIIGGAFSNIVTSLVNNIFTPILGIFFGGVDFTNLKFTIGDSSVMYGSFIQSIIDFLITALCIFIIVKLVNRINNDLHKLTNSSEEVKEETTEVSEDIKLLTEIRDLLKKEEK
jgi:large conductance mechanosensitive channel